MSISVYGGGDKGGRETAGEKGHIGSRKGKRDDDDDDDHKKRQKLNPMGIPDANAMGWQCPVCFGGFPKEDRDDQDYYDNLGRSMWVGRYRPNIIEPKNDGVIYHRGCLCANCYEPIEKDNVHIMFTIVFKRLEIPYNCKCLLELDEEIKGQMFFFEAYLDGDRIFGDRLHPPCLDNIFIKKSAPFSEIIDFLKIWGNYLNPEGFPEHERYWKHYLDDKFNKMNIPKPYSTMRFVDLINHFN
jgi:hypothetical protein